MNSPLFEGAMHFAWLPVRIDRSNTWVWLDWVYRETTTFADGSSRVRYHR